MIFSKNPRLCLVFLGSTVTCALLSFYSIKARLGRASRETKKEVASSDSPKAKEGLRKDSSQEPPESQAQSPSRRSAVEAALEREVGIYQSATHERREAPGCEHVPVMATEKTRLYYLYCSPLAEIEAARERSLTDQFKVPSSLARRVNFWRQVYSFWSQDHYVLHVGEWPEVVLEVYELKLKTGKNPDLESEAHLKALSQERREAYANLLMEMDRLQTTPSSFSPPMQRLAQAMGHISDPQKYRTAAESLRVQRGQRDFIAKGLVAGSRYLPWIEREFAQRDVPIEIAKLSFVESSFNLNAVSKLGASGVFQIMPATGRQYLRVERGFDERNDPIKGGRAAARILKSYYKALGSWPLAITAYNHGIGGIRRATEVADSQDLPTIIQRYQGPGFAFASKNFYASYLGILATLQKRSALFPNVALASPLKFRTMRIVSPVTVRDLAKKVGVSEEALLAINPDIAPTQVPPHTKIPLYYVVKIPGAGGTQLAGW